MSSSCHPAPIYLNADMASKRCHQGNVISYDTVTNCGWAVDIRTHSIVNVIDKVLSQPWPPAEEVGREGKDDLVKFEDDIIG